MHVRRSYCYHACLLVRSWVRWFVRWFAVYTVSQKKHATNFCPYFRQILTDFKNSFTVTLCGKFAMKCLLIIPQHLNSVATLPCETLMSVKLAIAAVSSCAQRLFEHFRKFRQRSQQMIRTTVDCDLSLWIRMNEWTFNGVAAIGWITTRQSRKA